MSNTARRVGQINGTPRKGTEVNVAYFIEKGLDTKLSLSARTAQALNYAAETAPGVIVPYNVLLQMVMGYGKQPRLNTEEVDKLRSRMTAVAKILHEKYGRGKHSIPGVGVRATVGSADRLTTDVVRKRRAAVSAVGSLARSMAAINIKEVPNTPELKEHREWFNSNSKNILESANDLIKRLLPPPPAPVKKD